MIELLEVAGFMPAITGMRLPKKSKGDSHLSHGDFILGKEDRKLATTLILAGDEHAKATRGIIAWFSINAPRYLWSELDTYTVGVSPVSSESTMHTLRMDMALTEISTLFCPETSKKIIEVFKEIVDNEDDINVIKANLPDGWLQKRTRAFSYQTLRRMYYQRRNHRLYWWKLLCREIENLPYFDPLINGGRNDD